MLYARACAFLSFCGHARQPSGSLTTHNARNRHSAPETRPILKLF